MNLLELASAGVRICRTKAGVGQAVAVTDGMSTKPGDCKPRRGRTGEVFAAFLKLGLTSFGGPIAHLGYFRDELVVRRRWLDERGYAELVTLCQFLPGPTSSQVGLALGLMRAGPAGALAAWVAFTLPSAVALVLFAAGASSFTGPLGAGLLAGLKIVAVAIVAQAVWGMAKSLCPDRARATIALAAAIAVLVAPGSLGQVAALACGGLAGNMVCRERSPADGSRGDSEGMVFPISRRAGFVALALFALLLIGLPVAAAISGSPVLAIAEAFYRAGALVFGGGHVVLPLLETGVVQSGWMTQETFIAGYGATQAVPGPLFTFAAYLGAVLTLSPGPMVGAALALVAIFLPGVLVLVGVMPFWQQLRARAGARAAMQGANAAVVGILGAALYTPVFTTAIVGPRTFAMALAGFALLVIWRTPPWIVVAMAAGAGALSGALMLP